MDDFSPVQWDDIDRACDRTFYDCPEAFETHRDEFEDGWWPGIKRAYDKWKTEYKRDGDPDQGATYLLAYLAELDEIATVPGDRSLLDRRPDEETLRTWSWDENQTMWAIAIRTGTHFAVVKYWLREDDIPLKWRNFGEESKARLRKFGYTA
ncbi:hypothetical protein ACFFQF_04920 [Haladaptatus pallidirubidus]|uniref:Uncharacterized protein n=1 Tax=Haladaptatus pallidirubidus TaxID=1008152 RepID=A0AAV3ULF9_9EURY|nr:hypothetical protein [Haladaptatus pallidirubidus]